MKRFQGIFAVPLTFYDESGGIDRAAMEHMTGHLIDNGVHGLLVLGSNGECPYLPVSSSGKRSRSWSKHLPGGCR